MARFEVRSNLSRLAGGLALALAATVVLLTVTSPRAGADSVGYLVNVTMRPGYHFADANAALDYGHGICDKVRGNRGFSSVMSDVRNDVDTADDYQASYLVAQAVDELCPELIWQLRNSAAGYRPPSP